MYFWMLVSEHAVRVHQPQAAAPHTNAKMSNAIEHNSERRNWRGSGVVWFLVEKHWVIFIYYFDCVCIRGVIGELPRYERIIVAGGVTALPHCPFPSIVFESPSLTEASLRDGRRISSIEEMMRSVRPHGVRLRVMAG
ncbi:retrotransposon hot spot (RHS) protein [Trypanosoma cruzi]|nr:retrotransposon hot spot (RHS) protein [Trypanosoma cruzi]